MLDNILSENVRLQQSLQAARQLVPSPQKPAPLLTPSPQKRPGVPSLTLPVRGADEESAPYARPPSMSPKASPTPGEAPNPASWASRLSPRVSSAIREHELTLQLSASKAGRFERAIDSLSEGVRVWKDSIARERKQMEEVLSVRVMSSRFFFSLFTP